MKDLIAISPETFLKSTKAIYLHCRQVNTQTKIELSYSFNWGLRVHTGSILVGLWSHSPAIAKVLTKSIWGCVGLSMWGALEMPPCLFVLALAYRADVPAACGHLPGGGDWGSWLKGPKPWGSLSGQGEMSLEQSLTSCVSHLTFKDISTSINI